MYDWKNFGIYITLIGLLILFVGKQIRIGIGFIFVGLLFLILFFGPRTLKIFNRNFGWIEINNPPKWISRKILKECKKGKLWVSDKSFYFQGKHRVYKVVFGFPEYQGDNPSETYYYKNRK